MIFRMFVSARPSVLALILIGGAISAPGCSSKPAETDTAEVVPDPAIRPAPVPAPSASPPAGTVETTPPAADEPKP